MHDEIMTELYQIRDRLSEKYEYNTGAILKAMTERQKKPFNKLCKRKSHKPKLTINSAP